MQIFLLLIFAVLAGVVMFIGFFALLYLWMRLDWYFRERPVEEAIAAEFPIGQEAIFRGRYTSHWEMAHFSWHKDGKVPPDWRRDVLRCELIIPDENGWSWITDDREADPLKGDLFLEWRYYDLEFRGKIIEKGSFGHKGLCKYKIEIVEMLSARRHSEDHTSLLRGSDPPEPPAEELLRPATGSSRTAPEDLLRPSEGEDDR